MLASTCAAKPPSSLQPWRTLLHLPPPPACNADVAFLLLRPLSCACACRHEAAAHHTLLQHAPPGSLLIDTGFVSPAFDALPDFYSSIAAATPANRAIGSLGDIPLESVRKLRLGCSLDGLLLTPVAPAAGGAASTICASITHSSSSSSSNSDRGGSASGLHGEPVAGTQQPAQQQQQHEASQGLRLFDAASIRRAPPYTWAAAAGYAVSCVEVKCPTPYWSVKDRPWAFACMGQDRSRPYLRMRAGHYCQSQLSMLVTGVSTWWGTCAACMQCHTPQA